MFERSILAAGVLLVVAAAPVQAQSRSDYQTQGFDVQQRAARANMPVASTHQGIPDSIVGPQGQRATMPLVRPVLPAGRSYDVPQGPARVVLVKPVPPAGNPLVFTEDQIRAQLAALEAARQRAVNMSRPTSVTVVRPAPIIFGPPAPPPPVAAVRAPPAPVRAAARPSVAPQASPSMSTATLAASPAAASPTPVVNPVWGEPGGAPVLRATVEPIYEPGSASARAPAASEAADSLVAWVDGATAGWTLRTAFGLLLAAGASGLFIALLRQMQSRRRAAA